MQGFQPIPAVTSLPPHGQSDMYLYDFIIDSFKSCSMYVICIHLYIYIDIYLYINNICIYILHIYIIYIYIYHNLNDLTLNVYKSFAQDLSSQLAGSASSHRPIGYTHQLGS